ncbi:MAG: FtsW/RodA/SpoVE family cell cycle protein [Planctomycetes bacterium]|nr:FtsW/RodA/SpoVE family cell cycle protein [Planctomycetota bacterium]
MTTKWLRFQLWGIVGILCGFGLVMIASTTGTMAGKGGGITYSYIFKQAAAMGIGLMIAIAVSAISVDRWRNGWLVTVAVVVTICALVAALGMGRSIKGATRWIDLGPVNLQPAELAKFAVVVAAAWHFGKADEKVRSYFHGVLLPLAGFAVIAGLIYLTRDLGSVLVLGMVLCAVLAYAGAPWLYFMTISLASAPALLYVTVFSEAYRRDRILAFLDPDKYDGPAAYHLRQSFIAIGSGGLFGVGLGESSTKLAFLPEKHTDFIYAVICEEFGMAGALSIAVAFLMLVVTGLLIAANTRDLHQRLLAIGATMILGIQGFWNMLVVTGAVPTKGLTLPFISYGGSSVVVCLALVGLLDAVARANVQEPLRGHTTSRIGAAIRTGRSLRWQTEGG